MTSIVTCTILNILSCFDMREFIELYKLEYSEVLNALSYFFLKLNKLLCSKIISWLTVKN
jgi:hypothetical protein